MSEIENTWREVPGFAGYFALPDGQVKRGPLVLNGQNRKEHILRPSLFPRRPASRAKSNGPYVRITQGDQTNYVAVAEIIAKTFVCESFHKNTQNILFKNHNPKDCSAGNLIIIDRH